MRLTGKREGLFKREIAIERDGIRQAILRVRGFVSTLTLENGTRHDYGVSPETGRFSLYWRSEGRDIVMISPMHRGSFAEGFVWQDVRYNIIKSEKRVFDIGTDGKKGGELRHEGGIFNASFSLDSAREIPVEAAVFLIFLSLAYPVLRLL
ncbi:MAG: hypothetical protein Q8K65_08925 [Alphaproteobacteria bacterium]|nr:hypothetical protein [Alphaproteobacteria bacterium]